MFQLGWAKRRAQLPLGALEDICFYRSLAHVHNEFVRTIEEDTDKKQQNRVKKLPLFQEYDAACWSKVGSKKLMDMGVVLY